MLSSIVMTAALAATVLASPLQRLDKRAEVTVVQMNTVTEHVVVTRTRGVPEADDTPAAAPQVKEAADGPKIVVVTATRPVQKVAQHGGGGNPWGGNGGNGGWGSWSRPAQEAATSQPPVVVTTSEAPEQTYQPPATTTPEATQPANTAPTAGAAPSGYNDLVVYHHNLHRANHSVGDVEWSDDLYSSALEIAQSCVYAHNTEVQGGGYGQNIAAGVEPANISAVITDLFYNGEEPYFASEYGKDNPDMTNFEKWGHFSQIVWKGTTHVACATQHCPGGLANVGSGVSPYFTVCNYKSPGNYAGEYAANVPKPKGQPTVQWNYGSS